MPRKIDPNSAAGVGRRWGVSAPTVRNWCRRGVDVTSDEAIARYVLEVTGRTRGILPREREAAALWDLDLSEVIRMNRWLGVNVGDVAEVRRYLMESAGVGG